MRVAWIIALLSLAPGKIYARVLARGGSRAGYLGVVSGVRASLFTAWVRVLKVYAELERGTLLSRGQSCAALADGGI